MILAVDVGGTKVNFLASGETEPRTIPSGPELTPAMMVDEVRRAARGWRYDAVSIGLPSLVGPGGPLAEPGNLGPGWVGFDFAAAFDCPVRIANDAAMQALGSYDGGRMLFLGFGTGLGSALIVDHVILPLELGDLPFRRSTFSEEFGREALKDKGKKAWRKLVLRTLPALQKAFMADYLAVGGGNAKHLSRKLPAGVRVVNNLNAFKGGFRLWGIEEVQTLHEEGTAPRTPRRPARKAANGEWRVL
jgi:polyphosphate glucokinase